MMNDQFKFIRKEDMGDGHSIEYYMDPEGIECRKFIRTDGKCGLFYKCKERLVLHNIYGPAYSAITNDSNDEDKWFYYGRYIGKTKEEFEKMLKLKLFW